MELKKGRPRIYDLKPQEGIPAPGAARYMGAMNELLERTIDQLIHLPPAALNFSPEGTGISAGWLALHLAWGDSRMFSLALGKEIPLEIRETLEGGSPAGLEKGIRIDDASGLAELLRRVRRELVIPWCGEIRDLRAPMASGGPLGNLEQVFMHMIYHWSYHSGQIGLVTLQAGHDYAWSFAEI